MDVPHELRKIDHSAESIAQSVQILDHHEERSLHLLERSVRRRLRPTDLLDDELGAQDRAHGERDKVRGVQEGRLVEEPVRCEGGRGAVRVGYVERLEEGQGRGGGVHC